MIAGILLAAGRGTRFGSHKLLHPLADGTPMVLASLRALIPAGDQTYVVVRPQDTALIELLTSQAVTLVPCDNADEGMGASLACGIRAASAAQGWVVALADMPFIQASTMRLVADALRNGAPVVAPSCQGQRGHPVGFAAEFFPALSTLSGDIGAKPVVEAERARLQLVACDDPAVLRDIDVPHDLQHD